MKKLFTSLVFLCAALVSYAQPAQENVIAESGPGDGNWKIVKVDDTTYLLKAHDTKKKINFQNSPSNNDFKGPNASQNKADLESCTGTLNVEGDFSNVSGFSNNYFGKFETVNLSGMSYAKTETVYIAEYNYQPHDITVGMSYSCQLSNFFKGAKTFTMAPEETVYMQFFNDDSHVCNLVTLNFSTGTKKIVGGDKQSYIEDISSFTTVNFNEGLEEIGDCAFYYGNYSTNAPLQNATFPSSLVRIGTEAFHGTNLSNANLSRCTSLVTLDYECFEDCQALATVSFPSGSTFTYFGNDAFKHCKSLTTVDMSMCDGITEFQHHDTKYEHFWDCTNLTSFTFPKNISTVPGNEGLFKDCPNLQTVTFTGTAKYESGAFQNPLVIEAGAFKSLSALNTVTFSNNLVTIGENAFQRTGITEVNLSMCHELNLIDKDAFSTCTSLASVTVCSHPKTIVGGQGSGAFYNSTAIRRVEVTACDGITDITQCKCECGAFDQDITYCGTNADFDQVEAHAAILVFPNTAPIIKPEGVNEYYTSPFDFFVGDYKAGSLIVQEGLQGYHKDVPNNGYGTYKYKDENGQDVWTSVTCNYQINDGWHEFIKTEYGQIIEPEPTGEFLRTYSRSIGDGPCVLPKEITAYRAVDYNTNTRAYIKDKNGEYYCVDESVAEDNRVYVKITADTPESDYAGKNRYSYLMVGGKVYLRPLVGWYATLKDSENQTILYDTKAHKDFYDDLIFNKDNPDYEGVAQPICINLSYVPENTGVVLYSKGLDEEYLLVLGGTFSPEYVLPEYPHTETRYEEGREETEPDNINMLQGTFDQKRLVSPVFPWYGQNPETGKGGSYNDNIQPRAYRNFIFNKPKRMWLRVKPGIAPDNFAFASIPVDRFDNFNEGMNDPNFVVQDLKGGDSNQTNLMLVNIFEDEQGSAADGIKVVNSVIVNANNNAWYTLQGVRVAQPNKGVYIHNGKKVVIK